MFIALYFKKYPNSKLSISYWINRIFFIIYKGPSSKVNKNEVSPFEMQQPLIYCINIRIIKKSILPTSNKLNIKHPHKKQTITIKNHKLTLKGPLSKNHTISKTASVTSIYFIIPSKNSHNLPASINHPLTSTYADIVVSSALGSLFAQVTPCAHTDKWTKSRTTQPAMFAGCISGVRCGWCVV